MKHRRYREWLQLLLYDELSPEEKVRLENHQDECEDCRAELASLRRVHALADGGKFRVSDQLLREARSQLRGALSGPLRHRAGSGFARSWNVVSLLEWLTRFRAPVAASAVALLSGLGLGYLFFAQTVPQFYELDPFLQAGVGVSNFHFVDPDPSDGEVEIAYDAVRPLRLKGSIEDERLQRLLAQTLLSSRNAAVRLQAVNAIDWPRPQQVDPQVRAVLIRTLKHDGNTGVRRRALALLQEFPFDESIKEGLLYVLINDENPGMRVAAINALEMSSAPATSISRELQERLEERIREEENDFIRLRSEAFLEEVRYQ
jgi:hypothetical protein